MMRAGEKTGRGAKPWTMELPKATMAQRAKSRVRVVIVMVMLMVVDMSVECMFRSKE
jgi:hypothetical protein